jgi:hypothetical protein
VPAVGSSREGPWQPTVAAVHHLGAVVLTVLFTTFGKGENPPWWWERPLKKATFRPLTGTQGIPNQRTSFIRLSEVIVNK